MLKKPKKIETNFDCQKKAPASGGEAGAMLKNRLTTDNQVNSIFKTQLLLADSFLPDTISQAPKNQGYKPPSMAKTV